MNYQMNTCGNYNELGECVVCTGKDQKKWGTLTAVYKLSAYGADELIRAHRILIDIYKLQNRSKSIKIIKQCLQLSEQVRNYMFKIWSETLKRNKPWQIMSMWSVQKCHQI